ncbi:MAG: MlaC/ttg2D family ABC transporter substrate-binding protein [Candidatus Binataceae bacterium]
MNSTQTESSITRMRRAALVGKSRLNRFLAVALTLSVLAALAPCPAARADVGGSPMEVVQSVVTRAIKVLRNKSTPAAQRRDELRRIVVGNFDFNAMSRSALGYHWRTLSSGQRADFTNLFTAFIEDAYLSKINDYSGQQVAFKGQRSLGQGFSQVDTNIMAPGKRPISVNYLLLQGGGDWRIYDVTVDNISIIANYRNQFNRVINDRGYNALISDLRSKQQQLAETLGERH